MEKQNKTISVTSLTKQYASGKDKLTVFEGLNFEADPGEFIAVLGPSGCGKSSFLQCLAGMLSYEGCVSIAGKSPAEAITEKSIAFAFQEPALIRWKTVLENVLLPAQLGKPIISSNDAQLRATKLLELVRLQEYANFLPVQLSGGMKQRTSLARALMLQPTLLLLDECFSALDSITRITVMTAFNNILDRKRTTCVMVTHNVEEAAFLADRIILLTAMPARIAAELRLSYKVPRNVDLLNHPEFLAVTSECRKQLYQYAEAI